MTAWPSPYQKRRLGNALSSAGLSVLEWPFGHSKLTAVPILSPRPTMSQRTTPSLGRSSSKDRVITHIGHGVSVVRDLLGSPTADISATLLVIFALSAVGCLTVTEITSEWPEERSVGVRANVARFDGATPVACRRERPSDHTPCDRFLVPALRALHLLADPLCSRRLSQGRSVARGAVLLDDHPADAPPRRNLDPLPGGQARTAARSTSEKAGLAAGVARRPPATFRAAWTYREKASRNSGGVLLGQVQLVFPGIQREADGGVGRLASEVIDEHRGGLCSHAVQRPYTQRDGQSGRCGARHVELTGHPCGTENKSSRVACRF